MAKMKGKSSEEKQKELDKLTEDFSNKIDSYFVSQDSIKEHLEFMSKFHNYSLRNMTLIDDQFRGANAVGSFNFWKDKGAFVKKGEKGIKILAPSPVTYFDRNNKKVQIKYATKDEKAKIRSGQLPTEKKMFFKVGHVFEYTQTNAREKGIEVSDLFKNYHRDGTIENDKAMFQSLEKVADSIGVKILDEPREELGTAKGASYPYQKEIALNPRNSDYEDVTVLIHELAHAKLHTPETRDKLTTAEKEFQAEMVSFVVANKYGIDTEDFSLSYLSGWTKGKELKDKEKLLNEVKETSKEFIEIIDQNMLEIEQSKENTINYRIDSIEPITEIEKITDKNNVSELTPKDIDIALEINAPEDFSRYLTYKTIDGNKSKFTNTEINEPMMAIHKNDEQNAELKPFGEVNNEDFDTDESVKYTTVIPKNDELQVVSSVFEAGQYAHPLHHMEKNNVVSKEDYNLLENNYHNHLIGNEEKYIKSVAPRIKKALEKEEKTNQRQDDFSMEI